jgi:hypothetical protein
MKQTLVLLCFIAVLLMPGCGEKQEPLPVSVEKAGKIILDTHLAEAALQKVYGAKKDSLAAIYYQQIYEIHGIDSLLYKDLIRVIRNDPDHLSAVYTAAFSEMDSRPKPGR